MILYEDYRRLGRITAVSENEMSVTHERSAGEPSRSHGGPEELSRVERRPRPVPGRVRRASPRRVRAWKARANARAEARTRLWADAERAREARSRESEHERFMRDHAGWSVADEQLRAANAAGAANAAAAAAVARTDAEREAILRNEDRARESRLDRHIEKVSIPVDRYTPKISDARDLRARTVYPVARGSRRVRRAPRRARRLRRVGAAARAAPTDNPAEPPEVADAPAPRVQSVPTAQDSNRRRGERR